MNKLGLNRRGHILFAFGLAIFVIYFFSHYIKIPYLFLILNLPFFIFGAIMPDVFESSFHNPAHRNGLFHRGFWLLIIPIISSALFYFWKSYREFSFLNETISYLSIILFFGGGWWTHLLGDSLTSKLR